MLSGAGSLLVRWSIFSGPEVSLFFYIDWEIKGRTLCPFY